MKGLDTGLPAGSVARGGAGERVPELMSTRCGRRRRFFWDFRWLLRPHQLGNLLARLRQHYVLLSCDDPESRWRRGPHWQRTLVNKWNAREFARRHGCRVPELYWRGRRLSRLPFGDLPAHYVLRPVIGHSRRGVFVIAEGTDLLTGARATPALIRAVLRRHQARMGFVPVLAEEFVRTEQGGYELPTEYGFFTFAGVVGAVYVQTRLASERYRSQFYSADWEAFADRGLSKDPPDALRPPPRCYPEMLEQASRLGAALGAFARVDFYATDRGAVFGEFSLSPPSRDYTPFADEYFGALWQKHCPDAL